LPTWNRTIITDGRQLSGLAVAGHCPTREGALLRPSTHVVAWKVVAWKVVVGCDGVIGTTLEMGGAYPMRFSLFNALIALLMFAALIVIFLTIQI
jgi:hypothetical protein